MAGLSMKLYEKEIRTLLSLPADERGKILSALLMSAVGEEPPELDSMENAIFELIKAQIERANALSAKRSQSGGLGGAPAGNANAMSKQAKTTKINQTPQEEQPKSSTNTYTSTYTSTSTKKDTPPSPTHSAELSSTGVDGVRDDETGGTSATEPQTDPPKAPTIQQQRFYEFWELYPNKKSKQDAIKAWAKIKPDGVLFRRMMDALREQLNSIDWHKENGRYIPHPASWLNGGCWDDVVTPMPIEDGRARASPSPITPQTFTPSTGGRTFDEYRNGDSK